VLPLHLFPARARAQVVHSLKAGVVEPAMSKVKSLRFACEAAITILRIDDFIKIDKQERR
jgi:T-complex protein 1 subunit alpha